MADRTTWTAACPRCGEVCEAHPIIDSRVLCLSCRHTWGADTLAVAAANRARLSNGDGLVADREVER